MMCARRCPHGWRWERAGPSIGALRCEEGPGEGLRETLPNFLHVGSSEVAGLGEGVPGDFDGELHVGTVQALASLDVDEVDVLGVGVAGEGPGAGADGLHFVFVVDDPHEVAGSDDLDLALAGGRLLTVVVMGDEFPCADDGAGGVWCGGGLSPCDGGRKHENDGTNYGVALFDFHRESPMRNMPEGRAATMVMEVGDSE
jgi:hypothetical protein